jgi:hypothetical protein
VVFGLKLKNARKINKKARAVAAVVSATEYAQLEAMREEQLKAKTSELSQRLKQLMFRMVGMSCKDLVNGFLNASYDASFPCQLALYRFSVILQPKKTAAIVAAVAVCVIQIQG